MKKRRKRAAKNSPLKCQRHFFIENLRLFLQRPLHHVHMDGLMLSGISAEHALIDGAVLIIPAMGNLDVLLVHDQVVGGI